VGNHDPLLLERAARLELLALDVDGVLTDGRLYFDNEGNEWKAFHTGDGLGLRALQGAGVQVALITGRSSRIVADRAASLGIQHVYQGSDDKLSAYLDLLERTGLDDGQVGYAGDDWIDLPVLRRVGLAVTVPGAAGAVRSACHWITAREGGMGAVRELCELVLEARGELDNQLRRFAP
jgi:3-deoxy-D-manno-octulosonate 8-phosphate phosphatase (KDO 8-P phosphatase)